MSHIVQTDTVMHELSAVNKTINKMRYQTDLSKYGTPDLWTAKIQEAGSGDCDDYALTKRRILIERGYNWEHLQPAICKYRGEGHLVLLVRTDKGFLILDNISDTISTWPGRGYEWLYRLDGERGWVNFDEQLS